MLEDNMKTKDRLHGPLKTVHEDGPCLHGPCTNTHVPKYDLDEITSDGTLNMLNLVNRS